GVQAVASPRERFEARDGIVEHTGEHSLPLPAVAEDPLRVLRKPLGERARLMVERRAAVEASVPLRRADLLEERIDLARVAGEVIAEQIAGIPIDEYAAEIEDDVADRSRPHHQAFTDGPPSKRAWRP